MTCARATLQRCLRLARRARLGSAELLRSPLTDRSGGPFSFRPAVCTRGRKPGAAPAEGLRMSPDPERVYQHRPVMVREVVDLMADVPSGWVVDTTLGGGGHASAILAANPSLRLLGTDRDASAVTAARAALAAFGERSVVEQARSDRALAVLAGLGADRISGALFDLGVSSYQLDETSRGFSYRHDAPLDMRMDPSQGITAAEFISQAQAGELARLFAEHGEERFAGRIASAIVAARPVLTTGQLADLVSSAVPAAARRRGHPAKRVFQALRVAVNNELDVLADALEALMGALVDGGRVVVISYHSGEDRLVKQIFNRAATGGCTCPPGLPCACGAVPTVRLLNRGARKPSQAEVEANPRARGARLRAVEALAGVNARGSSTNAPAPWCGPASSSEGGPS